MASIQQQIRNRKITFTVRHQRQSISKTFPKKKDREKWAVSVRSAYESGKFKREDFDERYKRRLEKARQEAANEKRKAAIAQTPTLSEAIDFYLTSIESTPSHKTERKRSARWKRHPLAGKLLTEISDFDIITFRDELIQDRLKASTIHNYFTCVSNTFRLAVGRYSRMRVRWPDIPENLENPVAVIRKAGMTDKSAGIPKPGPNDFRRQRILPDMETAFYDAFLKKDIELACAWRIAINTGMRIGEVLNVEREWINLEAGIIDIPPNRTKNKLPRMVALNQKAVEALIMVTSREIPKSLTGIRKSRSLDPNLTFTITYPIMYDHFSKVRKSLANSDPRYANVHIHDAKHEAASRMIAAGMTVPEVMDQTGNTQLESMRRYMNPTLDERKAKINRL